MLVGELKSLDFPCWRKRRRRGHSCGAHPLWLPHHILSNRHTRSRHEVLGLVLQSKPHHLSKSKPGNSKRNAHWNVSYEGARAWLVCLLHSFIHNSVYYFYYLMIVCCSIIFHQLLLFIYNIIIRSSFFVHSFFITSLLISNSTNNYSYLYHLLSSVPSIHCVLLLLL